MIRYVTTDLTFFIRMVSNWFKGIFTPGKKYKNQTMLNKSKKNKDMKKIYWGVGIILLLLVILELGFSFRPVVTTDYSKDLKKEATVYYFLPESILKITSTAKVEILYNESRKTQAARIIEQSFELSNELIADTERVLSLNYKPDPLMADDVKFVVNPRGLLESANITTEDRTSEIFSGIAKVIKPEEDTEKTAKRRAGLIPERDTLQYSAEFHVSPFELEKTCPWTIVIVNKWNYSDTYNVDAGFKVGTKDTLPEKKSIIDSQLAKKPEELDGIFTRPLRNIPLTIEPHALGLTQPIPINVTVADWSKLIVIPVERTPFVKRENEIQIRDGLIISHKIVKPSSAEGFISIPIDIAKAIVSIPAEIVSLKLDFTNRRKDLLEAEKNRLEMQKQLDQLKKEIEELKKNPGGNTP